MTLSILAEVVSALGLVGVTVTIHAIGLLAMLRWVLRSRALEEARSARTAWLLMRVVWMLMALHVFEIALWAGFYSWRGALPNIETALYFSGVSYATIGYGDVVLADAWRDLGWLEGLTGILMGGLSTAFIFAVLSRIHGPAIRQPK